MLGSVRPKRCDLVIGLEGQGVSRSRPGPSWTRRSEKHVARQVWLMGLRFRFQGQASAAVGPVGGVEAGWAVGGLPRLPQAVRDFEAAVDSSPSRAAAGGSTRSGS